MASPFVWQETSPADVRMDAVALDRLCDSLAERGTRSLLIVRRDRIAYEWYAPGRDAAQRHYTASLAKALVGGISLMLALADGRIGVDDLACKYIPAWRDHPQKSKITIRYLATHSSGIEDAEPTQEERERALAAGRTRTQHHTSLPGWKGAFWRREPDPFSIAVHQAPVVFEPGTRYAYSNPGMAALAYAVTASLREAPQRDIRALLKERAMDPIGVPEASWSIGYGQPYEVDGLSLYANWGGGEYTPRAVARVGRLMLHRGEWDGQRLVDPAWVRRVLSYAGTPLPDRTPGNPQPGSGLCWWTNFDGVWPQLPRDAFAGAGAGNQVLLVVPCRDLIVVRNGEDLFDPEHGEGFWGGAVQHLFSPLMDAFLDRRLKDLVYAPYPESTAIGEVRFDPPSTIVRRAFDSDNWPITWADDGDQYTAYGDGRGFVPYTEAKLGLGFARIIGPPTDWQGINVRSESGENDRMGPAGRKASGMLSVDGVLYMWARNAGNAQLAWSTDHARTWHWADWRFTTSFGYPTFLNYGQDYAGARDEYVYVYSHDADSAYEPADRMVLARVPRTQIGERAAYRYLAGLDDAGRPLWTPEIEERQPVFTHPGLCRRSGVSYNAPLGRYLWWQQRAVEDVDTRFEGGFGIYDAPEPWGPWTTAYLTLEWDTGPGEMGSLPTKWMSDDGRTCYLVFSGNDYFSVRRAVFRMAEEA
ncbi:MAG TPA: serine hydrolase [Anaerolineae bacterium]|nr:serine hydrolase [Anaerolineae bacterium]